MVKHRTMLQIVNFIKVVVLLWAFLSGLGACTYRYSDKEQPKPNTDSIHVMLTGGHQKAKTWILCTDPHKTSWGPKQMLSDSSVGHTYDYPYGLNQPWDVQGWLKNEFTFTYTHRYKPKSQWVRTHWSYANDKLGFSCKPYKDTGIVHSKHKEANFVLRNERNGIGTGYTLEVKDGSYIGFWNNGAGKYYILSMNQDTMVLAHLFNENYNDYVRSGNFDSTHMEQNKVAWTNTFILKNTLTLP